MKHLTLFIIFVCGVVHAADPLRVFILSGPKSHGIGAHDHPSFLRDWVPLLDSRGAKAAGGDQFPSKEQLSQTDVLIIHRDGGGDIAPADKVNLEAYLKRGGGLVVLHAGTVSNKDTDYYKSIIGGSWRQGTTKFLEGPMNLYFTDRQNPITKDCSNFQMDDEIYYDMDLSPDIRVLAAAYTPNPLARNEKAMKRATEITKGGKVVSVYDIQPQMWMYEHKLEGGQAYRSFVSIPGHLYANFSRPNFRALLLRGIAWAGKRQNVDEFCKPEELGDNLRYVEGGPARPEKAAALLEVHPDFNISLVASEPLVNKVINVNWDEIGRMWVAESPEYPNGRREQNTDPWKDAGSLYPGQYNREPQDRISWLEDSNGDGIMDKKHVFADKLELVTSFCFHKKGVIACSAPDIWYLEDTTGKGVCDKRTKLYTGLGIRDTHAVINNLRWGLDGWVYATVGYSAGHPTSPDGAKDFGSITAGVVRFKPDGSAFEQYCSKNSNTWGLDMTWDGQCFFTQPTCGEVLMHVVLPEYVLAKGRMPGVNSYKVLIKGQHTFPLMKWEQQAYVQIDQVGFFTAAAGCAIYEGGAWPAKWNYSYFTTEPTINIVSQFFVTPEGVSYKAEKEKGREETEFIRSKDMWFRPIENRVGPDGALYIVDFYNQAVIHNDTRGPAHGPANAAVRPDRDHYFSRIWKVQHKQATKLQIPVLDKTNRVQLEKTIANSPNAHVKQTAWRLLRELDNAKPHDPKETAGADPEGSKVLRAYEAILRDSKDPQKKVLAILQGFQHAEDDWTRSAMIAAASDDADLVILQAMSAKDVNAFGPLVAGILPGYLSSNPKAASHAVAACAAGPEAANALKVTILESISHSENPAPVLDARTAEALKKLLSQSATAAAALPLAAKWDKAGALGDVVKLQAAALLRQLTDSKLSIDQRTAAAASLLAVPTSNTEVKAAITKILTEEKSADLKKRIVAVLGDSSGDASADILLVSYSAFTPDVQSTAFDQLIKRSSWTDKLLAAVKAEKIKATDLGPANVARLRTHPDKRIAKAANAMLDKLISPAAKEKNKLLAALTPEVEKPGGDVEKGKTIFTFTCAICHKLGTLGKEVGPILDGMGAHSPSDLLIAVVDPNREVDPSFFAWNVVKKNGETLAGVIARENSTSLELRNQAGVFEIRQDEIKSKENTHRSLMPEGFEALGAEGLRDLMAFLNSSETRFRIVSLTNAFTADTRRGLFLKESAKNDTVFFTKFGNVTVNGIPFVVTDPEKSATGANVVVLKGGRGKAFAQSFPQKVDIAANVAAKHLILLSGVAGWGYPATKDEVPALRVTLTHAGGKTESTDLINGQQFADYNRPIEVPGSVAAEGLVSRGQLRLVNVDVKQPGPITKITLQSLDNGIAPVVVAITASNIDTPAHSPNAEHDKTAAPTPPLPVLGRPRYSDLRLNESYWVVRGNLAKADSRAIHRRHFNHCHRERQKPVSMWTVHETAQIASLFNINKTLSTRQMPRRRR